MNHSKQLARVIDQMISEDENTQVNPQTIDDYKKLDEVCSQVLTKIKKRKNKK